MASKLKEIPAYVGDSIHRCFSAAVNLWMWAGIVELHEDYHLERSSTYYIYPQDLSLGGPRKLNGYRVVVQVTIEKQAEAP